jgi:NAD(P)-dependent dehydrogenase (short-subunit alcohol dehydrogenase family)
VNTPSASGHKVWFVTGAATGIGFAVAKAALEAGDRVVATARNTGELVTLARSHGDTIRALPLDVTMPSQVEAVVAQAVAWGGRIDVLVNNAGYRVDGALEEQSEAQIDDQIAVNLTAAIRITRAVLPHMRAQRSGAIVQISSSAGQQGVAGFSLYTATKWGLEGFSESLALEVAPLGIGVTIVELGSFRTARRGVIEVEETIADYAETAGKARALRATRIGRQRGDPDRAAQEILALVKSQNPPLRVALGTDSYPQVVQAMTKRLTDLTALEEWSRRTDFDNA